MTENELHEQKHGRGWSPYTFQPLPDGYFLDFQKFRRLFHGSGFIAEAVTAPHPIDKIFRRFGFRPDYPDTVNQTAAAAVNIPGTGQTDAAAGKLINNGAVNPVNNRFLYARRVKVEARESASVESSASSNLES